MATKKDKKRAVNKIYSLIDLINSEKVMVSADEINRKLLKIAKTVQKEQRKKQEKIKLLKELVKP